MSLDTTVLWMFQDKVGMEAINDGMFLESSIYTLLKKYFRSQPYYVDLMELFHQVNTQQQYMKHRTVSWTEGKNWRRFVWTMCTSEVYF